MKTPQEGGDSIVHALLSQELEHKGGLYLENSQPRQSSTFTRDLSNQDKMFKLSCDALGIPYDKFGQWRARFGYKYIWRKSHYFHDWPVISCHIERCGRKVGSKYWKWVSSLCPIITSIPSMGKWSSYRYAIRESWRIVPSFILLGGPFCLTECQEIPRWQSSYILFTSCYRLCTEPYSHIENSWPGKPSPLSFKCILVVEIEFMIGVISSNLRVCGLGSFMITTNTLIQRAWTENGENNWGKIRVALRISSSSESMEIINTTIRYKGNEWIIFG